MRLTECSDTVTNLLWIYNKRFRQGTRWKREWKQGGEFTSAWLGSSCLPVTVPIESLSSRRQNLPSAPLSVPCWLGFTLSIRQPSPCWWYRRKIRRFEFVQYSTSSSHRLVLSQSLASTLSSQMSSARQTKRWPEFFGVSGCVWIISRVCYDVLME